MVQNDFPFYPVGFEQKATKGSVRSVFVFFVIFCSNLF